MNTDLSLATPFDPYVETSGRIDSNSGKLIEQAYQKSLDYKSNLPEWIIKENGMSGKKYRHFINNLVSSNTDARYLEIGSWKGSTVCSATYGNKVDALCIDNFSQFGNVREHLLSNIKKCESEDTKIKFLESDFRKVDYNSIGKFNIYFFDGPHEEKDQFDALSLALPALDDEFIFIVDDWNDPRPRYGTFKAIGELGLTEVYSKIIRTSDGVRVVYPKPHVLEKSDWHNGYYISVQRKKK